MDTTLYSKCFAGKACRRATCIHCLSHNHLSSECPENPVNVSWPWAAQQPTMEHPPSAPSSHSQWDQPENGALQFVQYLGVVKVYIQSVRIPARVFRVRGKQVMCPS